MTSNQGPISTTTARAWLNYLDYYAGIINVLQKSRAPSEVIDRLENENKRVSKMCYCRAPEVWNMHKTDIFEMCICCINDLAPGEETCEWENALKEYFDSYS